MSLRYKGTLPAQTVEHLKWMHRDGYAYFAEVSKVPEGLYEWAKQALPSHSSRHEGCMGDPYTSHGPSYCTLGEEPNRFVGFRSAGERRMFVTRFNHLVINDDPFDTVVTL